MQSFGSGTRGTRGLAALAAAALVVLTLAACGGGGSSSGNTTSTGSAQKGGTAYFAEATQAVPNYIFPFASLPVLQCREPLPVPAADVPAAVLVRQGRDAQLSTSRCRSRSPAVFAQGGTVIKVTMKPYKWSNGETVTAQDVVFWMNMMKVEKLNWAGYAAGTLPDDLASITTSGNTLTFTLTGRANSNWFLYNELSQITPMPMAWNVTKAGPEAAALRHGDLPAGDREVHDHLEWRDGDAGLRRGEVVRGGLQLPRPARRRRLSTLRDESAVAGRRRPVRLTALRRPTATSPWSRTRSTRAR